MVKGITRQVVVVKGPEPKLFEQAIFLVRENAETISEEALLQEARRAAQAMGPDKALLSKLQAWCWVGIGAGSMGLLWLLTVIF